MSKSFSGKISLILLSFVLASCGGGSSSGSAASGSSATSQDTSTSPGGNDASDSTTGASSGDTATTDSSPAQDAGGSASGSGTSSGTAFSYDTTARFNFPQAVQLDAAGNLYVLDFGNKTIRKVAADGSVSTVPVTLSDPQGMVLGPDGNLYVNENSFIEKVTPTGDVTTVVADVMPASMAFSPSGDFYFNTLTNNGREIERITTSGEVSHIPVDPSFSGGLAVDAAGNMYVGQYATNTQQDQPAGSVETIMKIDPSGVPSVFAEGYFAEVSNFAMDKNGNLFVAAYTGLLPGFGCGETNTCYVHDIDQMIKKVAPDGTVSTVLSAPPGADASDMADEETYGQPRIVVDRDDNIFVSFDRKQVIYKVTPDGTSSLYAGTPDQTGNSD